MRRTTGKDERRSLLLGLSTRLTYASVVSTICLFVLLGGALGRPRPSSRQMVRSMAA
jgi:hypothetical protein